MPSRTKRTNPFYAILIVAGVAFAVTACAYFVLMLNQLEPSRSSRSVTQHGLLGLMDQHGAEIMAVELVVLAVSTLGAISTERFWNPIEKSSKSEHEDRPETVPK